MAKISIYDNPPRVVVQLDARFAESDVDRIARAWDQIKKLNHYPIFLDLSSVTFISTTGMGLLRRMYDHGVKLIISGPLKHYALEEIRIREPAITVIAASGWYPLSGPDGGDDMQLSGARLLEKAS